jgi:hypothetical protein
MAATSKVLKRVAFMAVLALVALLIWFVFWRKSEKYSRFAAKTWGAEENAWVCPAGFKETGRRWGDGKPHDWRHCEMNENTKFTTNLRYDHKEKKWLVGECPGGYRPNGDQQGSRGGDRACVRNDDDFDDERSTRTRRPVVDDDDENMD